MYYDDRRFLVELRYDSDTLRTWAGSCTVCMYPQVEVERNICFSKSYVTLGLTITSAKYQSTNRWSWLCFEPNTSWNLAFRSAAQWWWYYSMIIFLSVRVRAEVKQAQVRFICRPPLPYLSWSSANVWRVGFFFAMVLHPFIRAPTTSTSTRISYPTTCICSMCITALITIDDWIRARPRKYCKPPLVPSR